VNWDFNAKTRGGADAGAENDSASLRLCGSAVKETEIGTIPAEWEIIKLGELFDEFNVRVRDLLIEQSENIPILSMTRDQGLILQTQKFGHRIASRDISNYNVVNFGQLVVGFPIDEGVIAILHRYKVGAVSPAYNVWELKREVDYLFLDWLLKTPQLVEIYKQYSSRTVHRRRSLSKTDFKKVSIPLPPLPEQRAIADVLKTVQRAREATEGVLTAARELKRSLMRHLFTYGPVPAEQADRVELQATEIGMLPAHWRTVTLGNVIDKGPQNGIYKPGSLYGRGTYILRIDDYENEGSKVTRASNQVRLSKEEISQYGLHTNDILVNRVNSLSHIGKSAIVGILPQPMVFESNMMRFNIKTDVAIPEYAFRFLCAPLCREQMRGMAKRAVAQSSINQGDVQSLIFPLPPLAEQHTIVRRLSIVDAKIAAEESRLAALDDLFASLLHHLMTGKVRVSASTSTPW